MGALHPVEQLLTLLLAFGPLAILVGVIWWRRRTEAAEAADDAGPPDGQLDGQPDR